VRVGSNSPVCRQALTVTSSTMLIVSVLLFFECSCLAMYAYTEPVRFWQYSMIRSVWPLNWCIVTPSLPEVTIAGWTGARPWERATIGWWAKSWPIATADNMAAIMNEGSGNTVHTIRSLSSEALSYAKRHKAQWMNCIQYSANVR